jgi:hypothetical protein
MLCLYETGQLNPEFVAPLFQFLINKNTIWQMQGSLCSTAICLIEDGVCVYSENSFRNQYGMDFPSRYEVKDHNPGSIEFQKKKGYQLILI